MNRNDITSLYTNEVNRLLAQGYQIHPYTMGGSQGEVAHIDLTNGSEILRVLLDRGSSYDGFNDIITITVGRNTDRIRNGWTETIWNNTLEILSQIKLAKVTENYFVTPEEAEGIQQKRFDRYRNRGSRYDWTVERRELGTAYKSIALRWLKKQPRMKTARLDDIQTLVKETHRDGTFCYKITAKGHDFNLAPRRG